MNGQGTPSVGADELIAALQNKIGQYEVEKTATELYMNKMNAHVADLESQLQQSHNPAPPAE